MLGQLGRGTEYIDVAWLSNGRVVGVRVDGIDLYEVETSSVVDTVDVNVGLGPGGVPFSGGRAAGSDDLVVVAGADGVVRVYSTEGALSPLFERTMPAAVMAVDISRSGDLVVAADALGTVAGWSLDGSELFKYTEVLPPDMAAHHDQYLDRPLVLPRDLPVVPLVDPSCDLRRPRSISRSVQ